MFFWGSRKVKSSKMGLSIDPRQFLQRPNPFSQYLSALAAKYIENMLKNATALRLSVSGNQSSSAPTECVGPPACIFAAVCSFMIVSCLFSQSPPQKNNF